MRGVGTLERQVPENSVCATRFAVLVLVWLMWGVGTSTGLWYVGEGESAEGQRQSLLCVLRWEEEVGGG